MKKLKYAVIGCGGIAEGKHAPAFDAIRDKVEIIAFCDLIEEKAVICREKFNQLNAKIYTEYKDVLEIEDLDAVMVLTPNKSHSFISVDALNAGKHVIVEKPMAINTAEAQKMVDAANANSRILTVAYQNRYRDDSLYLKEMCETGELGDIYYSKAHAIRRKAVPTWGVFLNLEEQGGGPLIDIGTHALDLALWQMDNYSPKMVVGKTYKELNNVPDGNAFGEWNPEENRVEDSAFGYIVMENGASIVLESSWALNIKEEGEAKVTLCGSKAGADMNGGLNVVTSRKGRHVDSTIRLKGDGVAFFSESSMGAEHREALTFYNAVANGSELVVKPEQALVVTQILEAIYESDRTGEAVYFKK